MYEKDRLEEVYERMAFEEEEEAEKRRAMRRRKWKEEEHVTHKGCISMLYVSQ